jgi:competence protein ComEC
MSESSLSIKIWDVQHGSAALIQTPNGKKIVQDLGVGSYQTGSENFSPLKHLKKKYGITKVDWVIITHPHRDHIDDIFTLSNLNLGSYRFSRPKDLDKDKILAAKANEQGLDKFKKYFEIGEGHRAKVDPDTNPQSASNNGGADIQLFYPEPADSSNLDKCLNNRSLVTILTYAGNKLILPGDNEQESWEELLARDNFKKAIRGTSIFIAPHHGRLSGFCQEIFDHFKPKLTIISDKQVEETDAADKYKGVTTGYPVLHTTDGHYEPRFVLSTRADKRIEIEFGTQFDGGIAVRIA